MPPTGSLPPREDATVLLEQAQALLEEPLVQVVLQAVGGFVLVLNESRQILALNQEVLLGLGVHDSEPLLGLRPGDALGCLQALEAPEGCHTSPGCTSCGAYLALLQADRSGVASTGECFLLRRRAHRVEPAEFKVRATPLVVGGHRVFVVVLQDISAQRDKAGLERLFYHDLQNTVQALQGWCELLQQPAVPPERVGRHLLALSHRLNQEVAHQRMLVHAEQGSLQVQPAVVAMEPFLAELSSYFEAHPIAQGRHLHRVPSPVEALNVDPTLLMRVLVNMVKNAMEAVGPGAQVDVAMVVEDGCPVFRVTNPGRLSPEVALGLFRRTFSTKGNRGRGYGTYSMKLLGETYLGGKVGFRQDEQCGVVEFYIELPQSTLVFTK